jgi:hypothetical protein
MAVSGAAGHRRLPTDTNRPPTGMRGRRGRQKTFLMAMRIEMPGGGPEVRSGLPGLSAQVRTGGSTITIAASRRCLSATRRHRAARHSASSIHISRARKSPGNDIIGGILASTKYDLAAASVSVPIGAALLAREGVLGIDPAIGESTARGGHALGVAGELAIAGIAPLAPLQAVAILYGLSRRRRY